MIQEAIAYLFTNNAKTVLPIVEGVDQARRRADAEERVVHGARLLDRHRRACGSPINRSRAGKILLAASMNPRGVTLLGVELGRASISAVWAIYGALAGVAGRAARHVPRRVVLQRRAADGEQRSPSSCSAASARCPAR